MIKNANRNKLAKKSNQRRVHLPGHAASILTEEKKQKKPLYLVMQKHWFDEILNGRKNVEYRDNTPFYRSRLLTKDGKFKRYSSVIMQVGYHSDARRMTVEIKKITLTDIFTIHLGNILDRQNFNKF